MSKIQQKNIESSQSPRKEGNVQQYNKNNGIEYQPSGQKQNAKVQSMTIDSNVSPSQIQNSNSVLRSSLQQDGPNIQREKSSNNQSSVQATNFNNNQTRVIPGQQTQNRDARTPSRMPVQKDFNENFQQIAKNQNVSNAIQLQKTQQEVINKNRKNKKSLHEDIMEEQDTDRNIQEESEDMNFPSYRDFVDEKERPTERKFIMKDQASYQPSNTRINKKQPGQRDNKGNDDQNSFDSYECDIGGQSLDQQNIAQNKPNQDLIMPKTVKQRENELQLFHHEQRDAEVDNESLEEQRLIKNVKSPSTNFKQKMNLQYDLNGNLQGKQRPSTDLVSKQKTNNDDQIWSVRSQIEPGFQYKFIGQDFQEQTEYESGIKMYGEQDFNKKQVQEVKSYKHQLFQYEKQDIKYRMTSKNEAISFLGLKNRKEIDNQILEYYAKNTYIRNIDIDEDPQILDNQLLQKFIENKDLQNDQSVLKEVKNVHISSDHQRAYVWIVTWVLKFKQKTVQQSQKKQLWLQVYNLASSWQSHSSLQKEKIQRIQKIEQLKLDIVKLQNEIKSQSTTLQQQYQLQKGQMVQMVHQNKEIQSIIDNARKGVNNEIQQKKEQLKLNIKQLDEFENQLLQDMAFFNPQSSPDVDSESQCFNQIDNYESVQNLTEEDAQRQSVRTQAAQKAEFSIFIGEFNSQKLDYMHDQIQSFYKQFATSEDALYFFILDDKNVTEKTGQSQEEQTLQYPNMVKKKISEEEQSICQFDKSLKPFLYKLSAFSCQPQKVIINDKPVFLPTDVITNQFSIIRTIDSSQSKSFSTEDRFLFALLKEVQIQQQPDQLISQDSNIASERGVKLRQSSKKKQLQPKYIESQIEIYHNNIELPIISFSFNLRQIPPKFDPKNISAFHKNACDSDEDEEKPVNQNVEFCCWYLLNQENKEINIQIVLNQQILNVQTSQQTLLLPQTEQKSILISKNHSLKQSKFYENKDQVYSKNIQIDQQTPIFRIKLDNNLGENKSFKDAVFRAKQIWENDLINLIEDQQKNQLQNENIIYSKKQFLEQLCEQQTQILQVLTRNIDYMYIFCHQKENKLYFQSLHPIIPDYMWASNEGLQLRSQIFNHLKQRFQISNSLVDFVDPFRFEYEEINKQLYMIDNKGVSQFSRQVSKKDNLFKDINEIRQSIYPHQIFNKCQKVYFSENQNFYEEQCNCLQECQTQEQKYFDNYEIQNQQKSIDAIKQLIKSNSACISKQSKNILDHMIFRTQGKKQKENLISKQANKSQVESISPNKQISQRQSIYNKAVGNSQNLQEDANKSQIKKKDTLKTKFIFEKLVFSQDMKQFIYTIKSKNKYCVHNQNENEERKRISFRGNQYSFDEDFEFYEYQIIIGQIDIQFYKHMIHSNEERDPFRVTQQTLSQFLMFDGITEPVCNPLNPYQNLFMMQDLYSAFDFQQPNQLKSQNTFDQMNGEDFDQDDMLKAVEKPKLKVFQTFQKISQTYSEISINENQPVLRNLPNQFTFINFQHDGEQRKNYFMQKLMQNNFLRHVEWLRMEQDVLSYQDFLNEQSLAKVWYVPSKAHLNDQYQIRTVDILEPVYSQYPKFNPNPSLKIDQNQLMPYDFLIQLFFNQMSIVTLKQQKQNPQNVIFVLRPNNINSQIQNDQQMFQKQSQQIYILGKLDKSFYNLESVQVIRQTKESIVQSSIYEYGQQPFQFKNNQIESIDLADYVKELYDQQNKSQNQINLDYQCRNLQMVSFDSNFGDSFSENLEIFAVKMWQPINSVKIFLYDYINKQTIDLYEIPLDETQINQVQNIQLIRISDEELTYSLLLDGNSLKEIYLINFINTDESLFQDQIQYKGQLFGKYDLINPNLENSYIHNSQQMNVILNQQLKIVPLYKSFSQNSEINILERDGFTVIIDQVRLDFDYKYYSNINGRERIRYNLANQSNIFQYEVKMSNKIKRNINQETQIDFNYFQFQIVKIKIREEILLNNYFNENQKLKVLKYFSKVAALNSEPNFQVLIKKIQNQQNLQIQNLDESLQQQIVRQYLQPRHELFGANYLSFLSEETDFFKILLKLYYQNKNNHNEKFCELDMNLMSPITWNIQNNSLETATILINFQNLILKNQPKEIKNQNSIIYYGYIKKLLNTKMVESLDFQDQIFGYEVMQQSLKSTNLPKYELKSQNFQNDFERNINLVERYMQQALLIDTIQKPNYSNYLFKQQNDNQLQEVQYGFIDSDWINILNIFNQNPLPLQKEINFSKQLFMLKANNSFNYYSNYHLLQSSKDTFMKAILKHQNIEIFTNKELQNIIDYHWMSVSENYYQFQLWIFVLFFILPLGVDIYYLWNYVFNFKDLTLAHQMFILLAVICQFVYFIKEIIDMSVKRISAGDFFSSLWHINGILSFPVYLVALIAMWAFTVSGTDFNGDQIDAIRILYMIVVVQTFFRFIYFARVYQDLGFLFIILGKIISDVRPIMLVTLSVNIMFGLLFLLLGISLGDEYNYVWAPIKWLAFALRNGLHDFSLNTNYGMLPLQNIQKSTNDAYAEGRGLLLHMSWVVWFANVIVMTLIIFNLVLAIIIKSYNSITENEEALVYQQKAEMINESQQVMIALKMRSYHDFDKSIIVRSRKQNTKLFS